MCLATLAGSLRLEVACARVILGCTGLGHGHFHGIIGPRVCANWGLLGVLWDHCLGEMTGTEVSTN